MILVQVGVGGIKQLAPQAAPMSMSSILEVRGPPVLLTTPPAQQHCRQHTSIPERLYLSKCICGSRSLPATGSTAKHDCNAMQEPVSKCACAGAG